MFDPAPTARLRLDSQALVNNWQKLDELSGRANAGAAIKANAYGLGAIDVFKRLQSAGCHDFFVANWQEAQELNAYIEPGTRLSVLSGVRAQDMAFASTSPAKPVLNSIEQTQRWIPTGRPCDVMLNSGMNRLGINAGDLAMVDWAAMDIDLVMSHLASADEDGPQNRDQLNEFSSTLKRISGKRISLCNSAGILLGSEYHFDCTRPGLSLYGGRQRSELAGVIKQVVFPEAQILQVRTLKQGDKLGYNARYIAERDHPVAIIAMGYADGYLRGFSNQGVFTYEQQELPVLGQVSMDLIAVDLTAAPQLKESDWVTAQYDLPLASMHSGLSQYELITGLGNRFARHWL
ncbi:alanine racemase [Parasphingorhabdus sp. JC815]|uniref:alanine racemase n=1 Tax=Parasphingorhabdus sp. JC815 TaxID=3232140 RepID=UPI003459D48F